MGRQPPPVPPLYGTPETREQFMAAHRLARSEAAHVVQRYLASVSRRPHEWPRTPRVGLRRTCAMPGGPVVINADWRMS